MKSFVLILILVIDDIMIMFFELKYILIVRSKKIWICLKNYCMKMIKFYEKLCVILGLVGVKI